jgi:GntR family transcriptional repressor for pyruvate dehydrogenase complex
MPFQKIIAGKISSAVTRQIEELILQGVLRPGDRLPAERELSETMEVSRPTLREALADLEERGLIATRPGGGTFIADVLGSAFAAPLIELFATHDTALFDYIAFRRDMEGLAAEHAAINATDADLAVIDSAFRRMEEAASKRNPDEEAALDAEFHMTIVETTCWCAAYSTTATSSTRCVSAARSCLTSTGRSATRWSRATPRGRGRRSRRIWTSSPRPCATPTACVRASR